MTEVLIYLFTIIWLIASIKENLFWLYLWQIKNYHLPRFLAHFETYKGKKLLLNKTLLAKLIIGLIFIFGLLWLNRKVLLLGITLEIFLYLLESLKFGQDIYRKKIKKPIWTSKSIVLFSASLFVSLIYVVFAVLLLTQLTPSLLHHFPWYLFYFYPICLFIFNTLIPITTSLIVFAFQPITIYIRKRIIKKAIAKRKKMKNLLVVGITGSYGKTSTKEFLATILSSKYKILKTEKNQNSEFGISKTILNKLKPEHQIFIAEMGAYCRGGISLLCKIAQPKIGILTGINQQHLSTFGSQKNIIKTKYELIQSLPKDGLAIFNGDNKYCEKLYQETTLKKKLISSKKEKKGDLWAENIQVEQKSISFDAVLNNGTRSKFKVNVLGKQNIPNILLATSCAHELGMTLEEISKACQNIKATQGAISNYKGINGVNIIESSYSSNPEGVMADLDYLNLNSGKKIVIMPCLIELNGASAQVHFQIGKKIGQVCDFAIITTRDMFNQIQNGAQRSGLKKENIIFSETPSIILKKIKPFLNPKTSILIEGRVPKETIQALRTQATK